MILLHTVSKISIYGLLCILTYSLNLPTRAFNLATRAFSVLTRESELVDLNS